MADDRAPMFHLKSGLWFERLPDAGVRISKRTVATPNDPKDWPIEWEIVSTAEEWTSVVASCSAFGETGASFRTLLAIQKG